MTKEWVEHIGSMLVEHYGTLELLTQLEYLDNANEVRKAIEQNVGVLARVCQYVAEPPTFSWHLVPTTIVVRADGSEVAKLVSWSIHT